MDVLDSLVDNLGLSARNVVHHASDGFFVARDLTRREHHHIVLIQADVAVIVDGDPRERGLWLSLRSRADADHVLTRKVANVAIPDLHAGRDPEIPQPLRNLRVLDGATADERDAPIELR